MLRSGTIHVLAVLQIVVLIVVLSRRADVMGPLIEGITMEVSTMRSSLTTLSSLRILEPDIKTSMDQMVSKGRTCFNRYETTMIKEGGAILVQKELILAAKSAGEVNVQGMQSSLHGITVKMRAVRDASLALQTDVHSNIKLCRGRKQKHETTIAMEQQTLNAIAAEIHGINSQMVTAIAGIGFAPFTGGLREQNAASVGRTSALQQEIQGLQSKKVQLENTILALQQMTLGLTNLVKYIDSSLNVFQTMDTTFKDVSLHSESFLIIQKALRKHPERPERLANRAQAMLEELQGKWSNMEAVLIANGARAISTCGKNAVNC